MLICGREFRLRRNSSANSACECMTMFQFAPKCTTIQHTYCATRPYRQGAAFHLRPFHKQRFFSLFFFSNLLLLPALQKHGKSSKEQLHIPGKNQTGGMWGLGVCLSLPTIGSETCPFLALLYLHAPFAPPRPPLK